jgi:hypothetical protein
LHFHQEQEQLEVVVASLFLLAKVTPATVVPSSLMEVQRRIVKTSLVVLFISREVQEEVEVPLVVVVLSLSLVDPQQKDRTVRVVQFHFLVVMQHAALVVRYSFQVEAPSPVEVSSS